MLKAEKVEIDPNEDFQAGFVDLMDKVEPEDGYQLLLMRDAGWIEGRDANVGLFRVTNTGHDYLEAVKDVGIWNQTKAAIATTGGSATLEVAKALAIGFLKTKLSKHTGIEL